MVPIDPRDGVKSRTRTRTRTIGGSHDEAVGDDGVFGDDHDAITNVVEFVVRIFGLARRSDYHVVSDAGIFVHDRIFDAAVGADADARFAHLLMLDDGFDGFVIITAEEDGAVDDGAGAHNTAEAADTMGDDSVVDDATVGDDGMINLGAI